jgi:tetratricopeptide (TPR) repeat protein
VQAGDTYARRASALALGLVGDGRSNVVLGPLLRSADRKLRLVVDDALRSIWLREGSIQDRQLLERVVRLNECGEFEAVIELATEKIATSGGSPELYHQRSLAWFQLDSIDQAIEDCRMSLKLNAYHYAAMIGLGHCHTERGDLLDALFWFRQAIDVYPDLEPVRVQIRRLEKTIQGL